MATYSEILNTNFNFENINIFNVVNDETGVLSSYRARPVEGYVMYNTLSTDTEMKYNPETGMMEEVPVRYYCVLAGIPKTFNFDNFPYIAVLRSEVDENYIFGVGDTNDHEVM